MNENEKAVIMKIRDAVNAVNEQFPVGINGDFFATNVFNRVNSPCPGLNPQEIIIFNVLIYHIQKDILEYTKSCFSEERLKQYLDPK